MRRVTVAALFAVLGMGATPSASADTTVARASGQPDLAAAGGVLFWSEREARDRYRLKMLRDGVVSDAGLRPDSEAFFPSAGTDAAGEAVLVYTRCPRNQCRLVYTLRVRDGRERRLALKTEARCVVAAPSIERGVVLFLRRGRCAKEGVWLRSASGVLRRLGHDADVCCTALAGGAAGWMGFKEGEGVRLSVVPRGGKRFALFRAPDTDFSATIGNMTAHDGFFYWGATVETTTGAYPRSAEGRVFRARPNPRAACEATDRPIPTRSLLTSYESILRLPVFAVDAVGLRYATRESVFLADGPPLAFGPEHAFHPEPTAALGPGCRATVK